MGVNRSPRRQLAEIRCRWHISRGKAGAIQRQLPVRVQLLPQTLLCQRLKVARNRRSVMTGRLRWGTRRVRLLAYIADCPKMCGSRFAKHQGMRPASPGYPDGLKQSAGLHRHGAYHREPYSLPDSARSSKRAQWQQRAASRPWRSPSREQVASDESANDLVAEFGLVAFQRHHFVTRIKTRYRKLVSLTFWDVMECGWIAIWWAVMGSNHRPMD